MKLKKFQREYEAKSEDAQKVVNLAESALVGANNLLWHMTEEECSANPE